MTSEDKTESKETETTETTVTTNTPEPNDTNEPETNNSNSSKEQGETEKFDTREAAVELKEKVINSFNDMVQIASSWFTKAKTPYTLEQVSSRESPDEIRTMDIFEERDGVEYRFEGTDEEFVERYYEYIFKYPLSETYRFIRPNTTRWGNEVYKRKPSLAILQMYTADNKLQKLNISVNESAFKEDLSEVSGLSSAGNFNNENGENCASELFALYEKPTRTSVRHLEECIEKTYCSKEYTALFNYEKPPNRVQHDEQFHQLLENFAACTAARPEFIHAHKVAQKLNFRDPERQYSFPKPVIVE